MKRAKIGKNLLFPILIIPAMLAVPKWSNAQIPIVSVIKAVLKKVINAIDLRIQQIQNKTIGLQNIQKELENELSKFKLDEIAGWVEKQRQLYADYYQELWQVKQIISGYEKVKEIIRIQSNIVSSYTKAYSLFRQDKNFSVAETDYMDKVYSGILEESLKNLDQSLLVVNVFTTQMDDAGRMDMIDHAFIGMEKNYDDLKDFNNQNIQLSLQRAASLNETNTIKKLYGLP
jgi:hypothetical protein